jgi:hypothetical protein
MRRYCDIKREDELGIRGNNKISYYHTNISNGAMPFQTPPLWVWAVVAAVIIASKFIYRWYATKRLAKEN